VAGRATLLGMSRLLVLVALVVAAVGVADHTVPQWAGPTSISALRVELARAPVVPAFQWPLAGSPTVTRAFAPPPQPWLPGHRGVDLAGVPAERVVAAGAGVVAFAGKVAGVGAVSVDHPGGLRTTYEPVVATVRLGQPVDRGAVLGALLPGHPGCPVAACLHWGLRSGTTYLDPLTLLRSATVRLLPLDEVVR
jgi:murein DD-endopeptidase MepM/ murein hydrolase activator NlpD